MTQLETKQQKTILSVVVITAFLTTFNGSALMLSIPNLESHFSTGATLIGWIVTAYTLTVAAMSVPFGKIADVTGRRRILLWGIGIFFLASVLCPLSPSIWVLILFRVLQGIGGAMIGATNIAILISAYPASQRGRVLGLSTASIYVGLSVGPVVGGFLNQHFQWYSIFLAVAAVSLIILIVAAIGIPKEDITEKANFDVPGNILYILCITVFLYGLTNLSVMKSAWLILAAGLLLGVFFVFAEQKASDPIIRVAMFTEDAAFTFSNLAALINYGATFVITYLMSIYLQVVMDYSSQTAGLILIAQPIMQALFSPMMGRLSDRIAPYKLASAGMALGSVALVLFWTMSIHTHLWLVILTLMLSGFGFALFSSPNTNAVMSCVNPKDFSVANSILATMRTVGQSSSMSIVTIIVGITLGSTALTDTTPEVLIHTLRIAFTVFITLSVIGVGFSMMRSRHH